VFSPDQFLWRYPSSLVDILFQWIRCLSIYAGCATQVIWKNFNHHIEIDEYFYYYNFQFISNMDYRRPLLRSMATSGWNWIARSPTAFSGHLPSYWKILVLVNQYLWLICSSLAPILSPFGCLLIVFSGRSFGPNIKSISYSQEKEFLKIRFQIPSHFTTWFCLFGLWYFSLLSHSLQYAFHNQTIRLLRA